MKYVHNTKNFGITLTHVKQCIDLPWEMMCYRYSDWSGDPDNQKSITGWYIFIENNPIFW